MLVQREAPEECWGTVQGAADGRRLGWRRGQGGKVIIMVRRLLLLMGAVALVATACGQGSDTVQVEANEGFLAASAERTVEAGTGRFEATTSFGDGAMSAFLGDFTMVVSGAYDTENQRSSASYDMGTMFEAILESPMAQMGEMGGEGEGEAELEQMRELVESGALRVEMVQDGSVMYMLMGFLGAMNQLEGAEEVPAALADLEDKWLRYDLSIMGELGESLGTQGMVTDPQVMLEMLEGSTGGVEEVGEAEVRGVATTRLSGTVTVREAVEAQSDGDLQQRMESMYEGMGMAGFLDMEPVDVYVDDEGLVRAGRDDLQLRRHGRGVRRCRGIRAGRFRARRHGRNGCAMSTSTVDFFDFGDDVDISVPPDDEVVDYTELLADEELSSFFGPQGEMSSEFGEPIPPDE
ncbi:MAG: hypothetical protein U5R31_04670 [Acidimicrobiia bacterium]|nr:hypothetical protein [Acidimicrobiia bacterium]